MVRLKKQELEQERLEKYQNKMLEKEQKILSITSKKAEEEKHRREP